MVPVHCHLTKASGKGLLPGMYVKASIEKAGTSVPVLPSEALVQSEGKDYILIQTTQAQNQYTFKMVPVRKGIQQDNLTQVILPTTVPSDAAVVVKGAYEVLSALINAGEEE